VHLHEIQVISIQSFQTLLNLLGDGVSSRISPNRTLASFIIGEMEMHRAMFRAIPAQADFAENPDAVSRNIFQRRTKLPLGGTETIQRSGIKTGDPTFQSVAKELDSIRRCLIAARHRAKDDWRQDQRRARYRRFRASSHSVVRGQRGEQSRDEIIHPEHPVGAFHEKRIVRPELGLEPRNQLV